MLRAGGSPRNDPELSHPLPAAPRASGEEVGLGSIWSGPKLGQGQAGQGLLTNTPGEWETSREKHTRGSRGDGARDGPLFCVLPQPPGGSVQESSSSQEASVFFPPPLYSRTHPLVTNSRGSIRPTPPGCGPPSAPPSAVLLPTSLLLCFSPQLLLLRDLPASSLASLYFL